MGPDTGHAMNAPISHGSLCSPPLSLSQREQDAAAERRDDHAEGEGGADLEPGHLRAELEADEAEHERDGRLQVREVGHRHLHTTHAMQWLERCTD